MAKHSEITSDAQLHYPKGFASAGDLTVPRKNAGLLEWYDPTADTSNPHASMYYPVGSLTLTHQASGATTWVQMAGTWVLDDADGFTFTDNNYFVVDSGSDGHYLCLITAAISAVASGETIGVSVSIGNAINNANTVSTGVVYLPVTGTSRTSEVLNAMMYVQLTAGDLVAPMFSNDNDGGTSTLVSARMTLIRLHS